MRRRSRSVFSPQQKIPLAFAEVAEPKRAHTIPEHKLIANIFNMAIRDAVHGDREAIHWLFSNSIRAFGCVWICHHLGFTALDALREKLRTGDTSEFSKLMRVID